MTRLVDVFRGEVEGMIEFLPRLVLALMVFIVAVIVGRLLGAGVARILKRGKLTGTHIGFVRKSVAWAVALLGAAICLGLLGLEQVAAGLLAGGGLTAVVLGFAFRQIGENFLAGFILAFSRPFDRGDLIESESLLGVVRGIELRYTHIRTADGRDIYIPSSQIVNSPLVNWTRDGLRRPTFTVGIDYADDAAAAVDLLRDTARQVEGVLADPPANASVKALDDNFVTLEVFFWINTFDKKTDLLRIRTAVMNRCRAALVDAGYTVSSNVTTALDVPDLRPLHVDSGAGAG